MSAVCVTQSYESARPEGSTQNTPIRTMTSSSTSSDSEHSLQFTGSQDWFSHNVPVWLPIITELKQGLSHAPRALEIGSWEGRSASFLLQNLCNAETSLLVCIDHFDLKQTIAGRERYEKLSHNLESVGGGRFRIIDDFSVPGLYTLLREDINAPTAGFDFIYIDGSHEADDTFLDAELSWRLARDGAIIVLDDYEWDREPSESVHHPKRGIDCFLTLHIGQYDLLRKGYQVILRKRIPQRIGFLCKDGVSDSLDHSAFEYGINIATCANSAYAMPAAVALSSAARATPTRRLSFYVIDCGLTAHDKDRIAASLPDDQRLTLNFLPVAETSGVLADATWGKIDMLSMLPVERALYLDADVLVRHDLTPLWTHNLGEKAIGAVRDIGHPLGHDEIRRGPYFNAGVLLLDLTRLRPRVPELCDIPATRYKDQDALNTCFAHDWAELDLGWNASGLGTYACSPEADRYASWPQGEALRELHSNPAIVHFTGPVHPRVATVLNEYVQPWTSKPWGYAGAPGHPFAHEWWAALEHTAWKGYKTSEDFRAECSRAREGALRDGAEEFEAKLRSLPTK